MFTKHSLHDMLRKILCIILFLSFGLPSFAGWPPANKKELTKAEAERKKVEELKAVKTVQSELEIQFIKTIKDILKKENLDQNDLKNIEYVTNSSINYNFKESLAWSYFATAKVYQSIKQPQIALQYLKLSQEGPNRLFSAELLKLYGELFSETGDYKKSNDYIQSYQRSKLSRKDFSTEFLYCQNLIALKDYVPAISRLENLLKKPLGKKERIEVLNKLAISYISTEEVDKGIEAYQTAISLAENNDSKQKEEVKVSVSKALKENRRFKEDLNILNSSIKQDSIQINSLEYLRLAESYFALKDYPQAESSIEKYIKAPNYTLIDKSEIEVIRNTARVIQDKQKALTFIDFYTSLEDTIELRRKRLEAQNGNDGLQNLLQLQMLKKEKEISQNAINNLIKEDALKEEVLSASRWAIGLLLGLILIGLAAGIYILKISKQRRIANQQLALRSLRSQMNPHFIFNALNSVNSFISENDQRSANKFLASFSKLMRLVLENSEHDFIALQKELEILKIYVELEHFRFKDQFEFDIKIDNSIDEEDFTLPPMLIQPYIENAVWHGLRYKEDAGELLLELSQKNQELHVTISDNGIGRKKSAELKTANQKKNKSTALRNIKERVRIVEELHGLKISVDVQDLNADGSGTIVKLIIPQLKD